MDFHIANLGKASVAHRTLVRLFTRVNACMGPQVCGLLETFSTILAQERPLAGVNSCVVHKCSCFDESFLTVATALPGAFACDPLVVSG